MSDAVKRGWIERVLGVSPKSGASDEASAGKSALAEWLRAKESVDAGISQLQEALRESGHPLLERISDQSLGAITKRLQVGLHVALVELDRANAAGRPKAEANVRRMMAEFDTFLGTNPVVPLLEQNPFGVKLAIASPLRGAMETIRQGLSA